MNMTGITIIRTGCQAPWKEALRKAAITTLAVALVFIISATAVNAASSRSGTERSTLTSGTDPGGPMTASRMTTPCTRAARATSG